MDIDLAPGRVIIKRHAVIEGRERVSLVTCDRSEVDLVVGQLKMAKTVTRVQVLWSCFQA